MLSICIPTRNRAPYLDYTLTRLKADFPDSDIVVSDNASTDDTQTVALNHNVRYLRQDSDIGPFPNQLAALLASRGTYAVYCADDDYLLPGPTIKAIAYLEAYPKVAAFIAPCEIYNECDHKPFWNAYRCDELTLDRDRGRDLFNSIIKSHLWPEHVIYRTPIPLKPRTRAYWAFADLPAILAQGAIHFSPEPFYRNLLVHPVGERVQLGNEQCLTYFDEYRSGLEVLAHDLFGADLAYQARHVIHEMISHFICMRMDMASKLYARKGLMAEAEMLRKRIAISSPHRDQARAA
jgi:glycosyltransferase involved in cell wall biosynthesis